MNRLFRSLPLTAKLLLVGFVPFAFLVYTSLQFYIEKSQKVQLLTNIVESIQVSASLNNLIEHLQKESKLSFDYAMTRVRPPELYEERPLTDSMLRFLQSHRDPNLADFKSYTFLEDLQTVRNEVDSVSITPDRVMHYYSTMIFRLNTLNSVSHGTEVYLRPVYKDLVGQKLLSEMITNLGIMRSNFYNVLYTRKYVVETLMGTIGVHDVYKTYEKEFLVKASPQAIENYRKIRSRSSSLAQTINYIDTAFTRFAFSNTYNSATWWKISDHGVDQLIYLQRSLWDKVNKGTTAILNKEKERRERAVIVLLSTLAFVIFIIVFSVRNIRGTLGEMKQAAQKIAVGDPDVRLIGHTNGVLGDLSQSIEKINESNRQLAEAADAIGKGEFDVPVATRGEKDILGNAVVRMKENLQLYAKVNKENLEHLSQMAQKYRTIFYKSPLPKWIYDYDTLQFLDVNEAAIAHYGYSYKEFLSMKITDVRPPEDVPKLMEDIKNIESGTNDSSQNWRHRKKNGEIIIVHLTSHFIDYSNRRARIVVINDITDKLKSEESLRQSHEELRNLASRLQDIREEERANMAREVHDVLGQQVTCIKMDFSWLAKRIDNNDPDIKEKIDETTKLLDNTATIVRKIASELRPSILDDFGLVEALEWQSREFEKRSGIHIDYTSSVPAIVIPKNVTIALFRIYQESLTNVARHSQATKAVVTFELKNNVLILTITDNGKGFDVSAIGQKKTLGLLGMSERTIMIGGKYHIDSHPGKGTVVTVEVPL
jgi:PAS domain S-box-containing protein